MVRYCTGCYAFVRGFSFFIFAFRRDTAGQERFHTITTSYYRGAMGIMLVYDITSSKTFDNIAKWLRNIDEHANEDVEKMILGNKCDVEDKRAVSKERGESVSPLLHISRPWFFKKSVSTFSDCPRAQHTIPGDFSQGKHQHWTCILWTGRSHPQQDFRTGTGGGLRPCPSRWRACWTPIEPMLLTVPLHQGSFFDRGPLLGECVCVCASAWENDLGCY